MMSWSLFAAALAAALGSGAASAQPACPVADSYREFQALADATAGQPDAGRLDAVRGYFERHRDLYRPDVIALPSGPAFDARVLTQMSTAHESVGWQETDRTVRTAAPRIAARCICASSARLRVRPRSLATR